MAQRFFDLADDVYVPHRWHLAMPRNKPLDFTEAGIGIPVVDVRVASMFAALAPDDV